MGVVVLLVVLAVAFSLIQQLFPVILIIAIIVAIYAICKSSMNAMEKQEQARVVQEQARIAALEKQEQDRIASVIEEINEIITCYTPSETDFGVQTGGYLKTSGYFNGEVMDSVRRYRASLAEIVASNTKTTQQIESILACHGCESADEKLTYLKSQSDVLEKLKSESDNCIRKLKSCRIQLLHEDNDKLVYVKKASFALLSSKKCVSSSTSAITFITDKKPRDLSMFQFKYEPVIFQLGNVFFCLFSNVILVFDNDGLFSAALDPSALKVKVKREIADYSFHSNVDSDSKTVTYTKTRSSWLYACKDGSPDLRYKNNRCIEYPVEVNGFEYGMIHISIGKQDVEFTLSSSNALDMFEELPSIYCHKCKHKHNPIPNLLHLIETISEDKAVMEYISEQYLPKALDKNYFCKIVTIAK